MSSPCPPAVLFLRGSKSSWRPCQAAPASPVRTSSSSSLVPIFSALSSSCSSNALLLTFFRCSWPRLPVYLQLCSSRRRLVFLLFSSPLALPWHDPLMLSCCPFGFVWSRLVLLLSSWCVRVVFLPLSFCPLLSSSCPPLVFLLSCCCRAVYTAFRDRG